MIWQSVLGCCSFLAVAWLLSENRRGVSLRLVAKGLLLTFAAGLVLVKIPFPATCSPCSPPGAGPPGSHRGRHVFRVRVPGWEARCVC